MLPLTSISRTLPSLEKFDADIPIARFLSIEKEGNHFSRSNLVVEPPPIFFGMTPMENKLADFDPICAIKVFLPALDFTRFGQTHVAEAEI